MRTYPKLFTTLAFIAFGPAIGALYWFVVGIVQITVSTPVPSSLGSQDLKALAMIISAAYVLCWFPAGLSGAIWSIVAQRLTVIGVLNLPMRVVCGVAIGGIVGALWNLGASTSDPLIYMKCGGIAGAALATLFPRPAWVRSSNHHSS